jgi:hypothetical protein
MPERKDRLSRRPKVKEERVENQISADNQIKKEEIAWCVAAPSKDKTPITRCDG